jgi:hypothetical protein
MIVHWSGCVSTHLSVPKLAIDPAPIATTLPLSTTTTFLPAAKEPPHCLTHRR